MAFLWLKRWKTLSPTQAAVISQRPYVEVRPGFLNAAECTHLINVAQTFLEPSGLVDVEGFEPHELEGVRTSKGYGLVRQQDPVVSLIETRIAEWVRLPIKNGESLHILHYEIGKEYKPHYDYFDPQFAGSKDYLRRGGQRVGTVLMFLADVEAGGETTFPKIKLAIRPSLGLAVYFKNVLPSGPVDPMALHSSAPVIKGEKWTATKWIHETEHLLDEMPLIQTK